MVPPSSGIEITASGVLQLDLPSNFGPSRPGSLAGSVSNQGRCEFNSELAVETPFSNEGEVNVRSTASFTELVQRAGKLKLDGGVLTALSNIEISGGDLVGVGSVEGSVEFSEGGAIRHDFEVGTLLDINGDLDCKGGEYYVSIDSPGEAGSTFTLVSLGLTQQCRSVESGY